MDPYNSPLRSPKAVPIPHSPIADKEPEIGLLWVFGPGFVHLGFRASGTQDFGIRV